jgi:class 3 adenylate cyclase/tetratricopeptide (TPR) repeat protein
MDPSRSLERRIVTVLFADLVGFTPLSEGLDPEDVATIQDAYFEAVRDVIRRHGGQLEKFIGDAAMAVFGMPRGRDDDPERAIGAGLALIGAVEALNAQVGLEPGRLQVRVGINTGEVVSAESGPDTGRVTGDAVNVAARLQAAAQPSQVLVGELTAFATAATVLLEPVEPLVLKGKSAPVRAAVATELLARPERSRAMGALRAPLIGRVEELDRLQDSLRGAARPIRWLIVAPPGVGKSRLVAELADGAARDAIPVWRAFVRPGGASAFEPVAQLLLAALGGSGGDPANELTARLDSRLRAGGISAARAEVLSRESLTLLRPSAASTPPADRDERFAAWRETLQALESVDSTTAWLIEDVHWAEPDLLAFVDAALVGNARRVIVCTARPALVERDPAWSAPRDDAPRLDLEPLEAVEAGALVRHLVGDALPDELVTAIGERSDGNPLFIEELMRSWISVGTLVPVEGRWRLSSSPDEIALPSTVQSIYAAQLDDLPPDARRLARHASVAGRRFVAGSLDALDGDAAALEELRTRALVVGPRAALLGDAYAYRHALLRDAGYASLARIERADLHVRLARWLEGAAGERASLIAAEIAQHYADALASLPALAQQLPGGLARPELTSAAAAWLERSAEQALVTAAPQTAARQLREAIELTPADDALTLARRSLRLAEAVGFSGNMDEGIGALDRAIELYAAALAGEPEARDGYARAVALRGMLRIEQLQFEEAEAAADAALARLGEHPDDLPGARVRYLRAWARVAYSPATANVTDDLVQAEVAARAGGDRQLELDATAMLDEERLEAGELSFDEFLDGRRRIFALGMELGQVRRALAALRTLALLGVERGRPDVDDVLEQELAIAEAHAVTEEVAWAHYAFTEVCLARGDWDAAWRHGLQALEIAEEHAYYRPIVRTWAALTAIAHAQGRRGELERAYAWFDPRRAMFPDSPFGRLMHGAVDARAAARGIGPPFASDDSMLDAWDESSGLPSWYAAAEQIVGDWIGAGRFELAAEAVRRMRVWEALSSPLCLASIDLIEAQLELAQDRQPSAITLSRRAAERSTSVGAAWWLVRATGVLEACDAATREQLDDAQRLAGQLGLEAARPAPATTS